MGDTMKCEQIGLIGELMQGKELAKQLCDHLISASSSSSHLTNEELIEKILGSYEKALTMLNWKANVGQSKSNNGSPRSEVQDSDQFKHKAVFKKRKTMSKWTEQVKVCSRTALEGSLDDGYSWRKYGQKEILGAKFPRGYYRCSHRNVQGCLATKQVQKSDEDPMIYVITYTGRHTCTQASHYLNKAIQSKAKLCLGENKRQKNQPQEEKIEQPQEKIFSFGSGPEVKVENLDNKEDIFPSFIFPSPSTGSENEDDNNNNNNIFSETMIENNFMECFSPAFISPETSESNLFCLSPCHLGPSVQTSKSDFTEIVSDPTTSVANSPIDLDFLVDIDFDTDFLINTPELCY